MLDEKLKLVKQLFDYVIEYKNDIIDNETSGDFAQTRAYSIADKYINRGMMPTKDDLNYINKKFSFMYSITKGNIDEHEFLRLFTHSIHKTYTAYLGLLKLLR